MRDKPSKTNISLILIIILLSVSMIPASALATIPDYDITPLEELPNLTSASINIDSIFVEISNYDLSIFKTAETSPDPDTAIEVFTFIYVDLDSNAFTGYNGTGEYFYGEPEAANAANTPSTSNGDEEFYKYPNIPLGTDIALLIDVFIYFEENIPTVEYELVPVMIFYPNGTMVSSRDGGGGKPIAAINNEIYYYGDLNNATEYVTIEENGIKLSLNWTFIYDIYQEKTNTSIDMERAILYMLNIPFPYEWMFAPGLTIYAGYNDIFINQLDNQVTTMDINLILDGELTEWTDNYLLGVDYDSYPDPISGFEKIYIASNETHLMFGIKLDNPLKNYTSDYVSDSGVDYDFMRFAVLIKNETSDYRYIFYMYPHSYFKYGYFTSEVGYDGVGRIINPYTQVVFNENYDSFEIAVNISAIEDNNVFAGTDLNATLYSDYNYVIFWTYDILYSPSEFENITYSKILIDFTNNDAIYLGLAGYYVQQLPSGNNMMVKVGKSQYLINLSASGVLVTGFSKTNLLEPVKPPRGTSQEYYYFSIVPNTSIEFPIRINITVEDPQHVRVYYYDKYAEKYLPVQESHIIRGDSYIIVVFDETLYMRGDPVLLLSYGPGAVGGELTNVNDTSIIPYLAMVSILLGIILIYKKQKL